MIRIQKILYPTDFSSYSNQAYFHAIALAENHGASLTVLFVYSPDRGALGRGDVDADRRYWREQLEQIRPTDPRIPVRHVFLEGDPATEIVRYGRDAGIDLIDEEPRVGIRGSRVAFLHPRSTGGVLTELVEPVH